MTYLKPSNSCLSSDFWNDSEVSIKPVAIQLLLNLKLLTTNWSDKHQIANVSVNRLKKSQYIS